MFVQIHFKPEYELFMCIIDLVASVNRSISIYNLKHAGIHSL